MSIKSKIQALITAANTTTGESATDLTGAVQTLVDGYGQGGTEITDGIVVKARNANGYATEIDYYGTIVNQYQFGSDNTANFTWKQLSIINFKNTITSIETSGFRNSIVGLTIPQTVRNIGNFAFNNTNISVAAIPPSCTIGNGCFYTCKALTNYTDEQPAGSNYNQNSGVLTGCTALQKVQIGSIGHACTNLRNNTFLQCTQIGLEISFFTTGAYADTALANARNGATNATIIIKASENTTYNGVSYAAGETMITSNP